MQDDEIEAKVIKSIVTQLKLLAELARDLQRMNSEIGDDSLLEAIAERIKAIVMLGYMQAKFSSKEGRAMNDNELGECFKQYQALEESTCEWIYSHSEDYYVTECGHAQLHNSSGIADNGFRFCPCCGRLIKEKNEL